LPTSDPLYIIEERLREALHRAADCDPRHHLLDMLVEQLREAIPFTGATHLRWRAPRSSG